MPAVTNAQPVQVEDLRVNAGDRTILDLPRLGLQPGEVLGVLGPNGAGKTTLLNALLGFRRPTAGTIRVLEVDVPAGGSFSLAGLRRRIGYIPQLLAAHSLMPLTVREIVAIGRTGRAGLFRRLQSADWRSVDAWIDKLGLAPLRNAAYAELSGGEQRKTLLARAMVQEPELLLLDEPAANLDLGWRERIVATLQALHDQSQLPMILVCHELEVLPPCCERVLLLEQGRALADGAPRDVLTPDRVDRLYGPGLRIWHGGGRHSVLPANEGASHV